MITAQITEIPVRDVRNEFYAYGIRPTMQQLINFAARLETESLGFNEKEVEAALWYAVRAVSRRLDRGMNFDRSLDEIKWPSNDRGRKLIPINRVVRMHRRAPRDPKRERNKIYIRLRELIEDFQRDQEEIKNDFHSTLNPFKRRRISKEIIPLDEFLFTEAKKALHEDFPGSPHIDGILQEYSKDSIRESLGSNKSRNSLDANKFRRWVNDSLFEFEESGRARVGWQNDAIRILKDNYPSRRDDSNRVYKKAQSIWKEFEASSSRELSDLAVDLRNQFGVGK